MNIRKFTFAPLIGLLFAVVIAAMNAHAVQARPCKNARGDTIPCPATRTPTSPASTATFTPALTATFTPVGTATFTATAVPSATATVQANIPPDLNSGASTIVAVAVHPWPWNYSSYGDESFTPLVAAGLAIALGLVLLIGVLVQVRRTGKSAPSDPAGTGHYPADELDVFPREQDEGSFGGQIFGDNSGSPNAGDQGQADQGRPKKH